MNNGNYFPRQDKYTVGARITYSCADGYELEDSTISSLTCGADKEWRGPAPQCVGQFFIALVHSDVLSCSLGCDLHKCGNHCISLGITAVL